MTTLFISFFLTMTSEFERIPFNNVQTGNPILSPNSVQITSKYSHSHTGATSASGGNVAAPLIGLGVISGQERRNKGEIITLTLPIG